MRVCVCAVAAPDKFAAYLLAELMSLCLRAARQNVLLLQLPLTGPVPQFDVEGVSSTDLIGQGTFGGEDSGQSRVRTFNSVFFFFPSAPQNRSSAAPIGYVLFVYSSSSSSSSSRYRIGPSESESLVWLSLGLSGITVTWACSVFTLGRCGFSAKPSAELLEKNQLIGSNKR